MYDSESWCPLGNIIGGTTYPGNMFTSSAIQWICNTFLFSVDIKKYLCLFSYFICFITAITSYFLVKEITGRSDSGLLTSLLIGIVPGSVAGSYDNEAIAIPDLIMTFYFYIKSLYTGSIFWSTICSLIYFYMVNSWGGYVFIINLIPLYNLFLVIIGRLDIKIYTSYTVFYIV